MIFFKPHAPPQFEENTIITPTIIIGVMDVMILYKLFFNMRDEYHAI
jgi:hypothetical protein